MTSNDGTDRPSVRDQIFDFVVRYKEAHNGNSPSLREIAEACSIVISGVHYHLARLEMENRIRRRGKYSRTIEIVGTAWQPPGDPPSRSTEEQDSVEPPVGQAAPRLPGRLAR